MNDNPSLNPPSPVDRYIGGFDSETRRRLDAMREIITLVAPAAEEAISYGLVGYKLYGKPLVYFGAFPKHIGFYATPTGHASFSEELSAYKQGKGSVQFPLSEPLPLGLIKRIVEFRVQARS